MIDVNGNNPSEVVDISSNRCLFNLTSLNMLNMFRGTNVEFGILPYPKLDEAQEDYISIDWTGLMCAPLVAEDHNIIGEFIDNVVKTCYNVAGVSQKNFWRINR